MFEIACNLEKELLGMCIGEEELFSFNFQDLMEWVKGKNIILWTALHCRKQLINERARKTFRNRWTRIKKKYREYSNMGRRRIDEEKLESDRKIPTRLAPEKNDKKLKS